MTQLENERECTNLSKNFYGNWALPNGRESAKSLEWYMSHHNISTVWLGIRRSSMEIWQWVNGKKDERFKEAPGNHGCAVVSIDYIIKSHECADEIQGFLCELPGNSSCPRSRQESYCITANNKQYWFRCEAKNWFTARNNCQRQGGDLVVIQNHEIKRLLQPIGANQPLRCTSFFIGLHREYWLRTTPTGAIELVRKENWALNEPTSKDCAVFALNAQSHRGAWRAEECFSLKQGLCEKYSGFYEESTKSYVPTRTSCLNVSKISSCESGQFGCRKEIIITLMVTLGAFAIMTAATLFWWRKGKRKTTENENRQRENQGFPLVNVDEANRPVQIEDQIEENEQVPVAIENEEERNRLLPIDQNAAGNASHQNQQGFQDSQRSSINQPDRTELQNRQTLAGLSIQPVETRQ